MSAMEDVTYTKQYYKEQSDINEEHNKNLNICLEQSAHGAWYHIATALAKEDYASFRKLPLVCSSMNKNFNALTQVASAIKNMSTTTEERSCFGYKCTVNLIGQKLNSDKDKPAIVTICPENESDYLLQASVYCLDGKLHDRDDGHPALTIHDPKENITLVCYYKNGKVHTPKKLYDNILYHGEVDNSLIDQAEEC